jgi:TonB family protein
VKGFHVPIFAVAVGASLVAHWLVWTSAKVVTIETAPISLGGREGSARRPAPITIALNTDGEPANEFPAPEAIPAEEAAKAPDATPDKSAPPEAEPPAPVVPPPPPPPPPKQEVEKYPDKIGRNDGTGIGTHEAKGPKPLVAREGDNDQPNLSRDPRGPGMPDKPTPTALPPGDGGAGGRAGGPPVPELPAPPEPSAATPPPPVASPSPLASPPPAASPTPAPAAAKAADVTPPAKQKEEPRTPDSSARSDGPAAVEPAKPREAAKPVDPPNVSDADPDPRAEPGPPREGPMTVKVPADARGVESENAKPNPRVKERGPLTLERPGIDAPLPADASAADRQARRDGLLPPPPAARLATSPPPAPLVRRVPPPSPAAASPATPPVDAGLTPAPPTPSPTPPTPAAPTQPKAVVAMLAPRPTPQATGDGGRPGVRTQAADPAQESDSEVDAFSKIGSLTLRRDGSLPVQFGRQVKTVRPHIPIQGYIDAALGARSVSLRVGVGADGTVTTVAVERGSGSPDLDQASLIAMYDWWFEPLKDKKGRTVPDVVLFTLNYR